MSSLNLVPNPSVMVVQAGLFIANFVAIKKLLLEPYLKVYDKRQSLTVGNKSEADQLIQKNENAMLEIKQRILEANEQASQIRTELTQAAHRQKTQLIADAETTAKKTVEGVRSQISQSLEQEMAKVPALVDEITAMIVNQVIKA